MNTDAGYRWDRPHPDRTKRPAAHLDQAVVRQATLLGAGVFGWSIAFAAFALLSFVLPSGAGEIVRYCSAEGFAVVMLVGMVFGTVVAWRFVREEAARTLTARRR